MVIGSALSVILLFLQILSAFFITPLMIKNLGDKHYGIWILISNIIGYYGLFDLGISGAVQRYISKAIGTKNSMEKKNISSTSFYIFGGIGICILIITVILISYVHYFLKATDEILLVKTILLILGAGVGITFPFRIFTGILNANLRFDISRYIELFVFLIRTSAIFYVLINNGTLLQLAIITVLSTFIDYLFKWIFAVYIDKDVSISLTYFRLNKIKVIFDYSTYTFLAQIAKMLSEKSGPIIIAKFISVAAVTSYGVAFNFIIYFMQFIWSIVGVIGPVFSQDEGKRDIGAIKEKFIFTINICCYISIFCGGISILYGDQFINRWLGPDYNIVYTYMVIFMIPMTINLCMAPIYYLLNNISKHKVLSVVQITESTSTVLLSIILGNKMGTIGVVYGFSIPLLFFTLFVRPIIACNSIQLKCWCFFILILKNTLLSIISIITVWIIIKNYVVPTYSSIIFSVSLHAVVYLPLCTLLGFNQNERNLIFNYFPLTRRKIKHYV